MRNIQVAARTDSMNLSANLDITDVVGLDVVQKKIQEVFAASSSSVSKSLADNILKYRSWSYGKASAATEAANEWKTQFKKANNKTPSRELWRNIKMVSQGISAPIDDYIKSNTSSNAKIKSLNAIASTSYDTLNNNPNLDPNVKLAIAKKGKSVMDYGYANFPQLMRTDNINQQREVYNLFGEVIDGVQGTKKNTGDLKAIAAYSWNAGRALTNVTSGMFRDENARTNLWQGLNDSAGAFGGLTGSLLGAIGGPVGAIVGGTIGKALGDVTSGVANTVHGAWRMTATRAFRVADRRALLGDQYSDPYTRALEGVGISSGAALGAVEKARYFGARASWGDLSEKEFVGMGILKNYYAAVRAGADERGIMEALQLDKAERGDGNFYMGLKNADLSPELMKIDRMNMPEFQKAINSDEFQRQEIADIQSNVRIIADYFGRDVKDYMATNRAVNETYEFDADKASKKESIAYGLNALAAQGPVGAAAKAGILNSLDALDLKIINTPGGDQKREVRDVMWAVSLKGGN